MFDELAQEPPTEEEIKDMIDQAPFEQEDFTFELSKEVQ